MRNKKDNDGRISKRSSTGIRHDAGTAEKREPIRDFEEADDLRKETARRRERDDDRERDSRRPRDDRYDERDSRRSRDDAYDDRRYRDDRYDDRRSRDDRYDDRYDDRRYRDDRYDDRDDRRRYRDDRYDRDDEHPRSGRREPPRWDEYRFDEEDTRDKAPRREEKREARQQRRAATRPIGGDPELFIHQIVPYVVFWVALFAAVSFILRDIVGIAGAAGTFGNWLANALGGLMGPIAYLLPLWFVVLSLRWKSFVKEGVLFKKLLFSAAFLWLLSGIVHVFLDDARGELTTEGLFSAGAGLAGGGLFGGFLGEWMGYVLYLWGTILLAIPLLIIIGIYLVGMTPTGIWQRISCKIKMASQRRAKQRLQRYDGQEERTLRVKGSRASEAQNALQRGEPAEQIPAAEPMHYTFEEDDSLEAEYTARRNYKNRLRIEPEEETVQPSKEPVQVMEEPVQEKAQPQPTAAVREPADRVHSSADIVDIPDDEIEIDEPLDDIRVILNRAGQTESSEEKLDQILREVTANFEQPIPAAPAAPVATPTPVSQPQPEERPLRGTSYSPFALHQHFDAPAEAAGSVTPAVQADPRRPSYLTEEPLGSLNPIHRERTAVKPEATPQSARTSAPREETLAYTPMPTQSPVREAQSAVSAHSEEPRRETPPTSGMTLQFSASEPVPAAKPAPKPVLEEEPTREEPVAEAPTVAPASRFGFVEDPVEPAREQPAKGVRKMLGVTEPSAKEAPTETPAVPFARETLAAEPAAPAEPEHKEEPQPRVIPMRQKPQVLTRTEPVKEEKKVAPPPPPRAYRLPPISLLNEDKSVKENDHSEEIREKIDTLLTTLKSFNIRVKDRVDCSRGPTITRYELRPEPGVSVRSVMNRADDISLNMAAPVRIEAPIPGKPAIGIEVPNAEREMVFMRTVLESEQYKSSTKPLEVPLGLDVGGAIQMCDLAKMPHLLVAGSTGSGKSVCINTILISLMYKTSPADLRLILIDPKQVEFTSYNHIPHLYAPIVTDAARAVGVLACAVQEMERRYSLIKDVGVRNIEGYNAAIKNDPEREHLPYMVIVIDEFADLKMACTNNDVETFTCRLAQKARAAGMHLIIGTQRPTVSVITGNLKNNIPSRIAFKVTQQTDSRTILDANGAEQLIGRGDMLYMTAGLPKPNRVQGAFVSDEEVQMVADYVRDHNDEVQYNQAFMDQIEAELARAAAANRKDDDFDDMDDDGDDEDPKFREAVELAIETQKVATSLLQRRLGVGYGRAAKIIDRMEALGYVSAPEGNKARKVLITHAEYAAKMMDGEGDFSDENY